MCRLNWLGMSLNKEEMSTFATEKLKNKNCRNLRMEIARISVFLCVFEKMARKKKRKGEEITDLSQNRQINGLPTLDASNFALPNNVCFCCYIENIENIRTCTHVMTGRNQKRIKKRAADRTASEAKTENLALFEFVS